MTFFSILIALIIERFAPQFIDLRRFQWLSDYSQWLAESLHIKRFGPWMALAVLLAPLVILMWILSGMFENAVFGLFELAFAVAVVFYCLGPKDVNQEIDQYLEALEVGDETQQLAAAGRLTGETAAQDLGNQADQVSQSIFVESNLRTFSIVFWFATLGPVVALVYRLIEQLLRGQEREEMNHLRAALRTSLAILDWIPARLTLFAFMLSGSFDEGLQALRKGTVLATDLFEQNLELLKVVGYRSIHAQTAHNASQAIILVRKARGLVLRSLIVWLLLVVVLGWLG